MIELINRSTIGERPLGHQPDGTGDADVDAFHHRFNPSTQSVAGEVVSAVATIKNTQETDLEPLYDTVDTDALEVLVSASAGHRGAVEVQFRYEGLEITVSGTGDIWLHWD